MVNFLIAAMIAATPLLFATLGELLTERSGNLNLGVEGMMLMGAVVGFQVGIATGSPVLALLGAILAGAFGALIFAVLTVTLRANQVVSGLALTIFGTGFAKFFGQRLAGLVLSEKFQDFFNPIKLPLFGDLPYIGPILFRQDIFVYLGYFTAILMGIYLYRTGKGLNLRAVGENAAAADASGIHVNLYKYVNILIGGALCGLGGAYLSLVYVPTWQENITAGRGWIAVALVIFTSWNPYRALLGAFVFGALDIVGFRLQSTKIQISQFFFDMIPYIATFIVVIAGAIRKKKNNAPPQGLGIPYFREER